MTRNKMGEEPCFNDGITSKDFCKLVDSARNEWKFHDEDFTHVKALQKIQTDGKKMSETHPFVLYCGIIFLLMIGFPTSLYMSVTKETNFGSYIVEKYVTCRTT